jgi:hypothetical protein
MNKNDNDKFKQWNLVLETCIKICVNVKPVFLVETNKIDLLKR